MSRNPMMETVPGPKVVNYIQPLNPLTIDEAVRRFAAPAGSAAKVQLLNPPRVFTKTNFSLSLSMPIGPVYIAALLERAGYDVTVIDAVGEGINKTSETDCGRYFFQGLEVEEIIERIHPDTRVLGVSLLFSAEWLEHKSLIRKIRAARPDLIIVAGGEHATAIPEYTLRDCSAINYVISGEGELAFLVFCHLALTDQQFDRVPGLSLIDPGGHFVRSGPALRIEMFNDLPRPAWHLINVEAYRSSPYTHGSGGGFYMPILATRGCPYQCTFCSNPTMWTTRYFMREPTKVVDEVQGLVETYGVEGIVFSDLTAFTKKRWILDFCREIRVRDLSIEWQLPSGTRSEALDEEVLTALFDAGVRRLTYAPESGSEETLRQIKKKVKLDRLTESARSAIKIGLKVSVNLIFGFPHETRIAILRSAAFNLKMAVIGAHDGYPWIFSPYPGSELYRQLRDENVLPPLSDDYFHRLYGVSDFHTKAINCSHIPTWELNAYRVVSSVLFYVLSYSLRPTRIWRFVRNLLRKEFRAENMLEQRLYEKFATSLRSAGPSD